MDRKWTNAQIAAYLPLKIPQTRLRDIIRDLHDVRVYATREGTAYSVTGLPGSLRRDIERFYDDYDFMGTSEFSSLNSVMWMNRRSSVNGLETGGRMRVLTDDPSQDTMTRPYVYIYDSHERLTAQCHIQENGNRHTVRQQYDRAGNVVSTTEMFSGHDYYTDTTYDTLGRPVSRTDAMTSRGNVVTTQTFRYDMRGRLDRLQIGQSHTTSYENDARGAITKITAPNYWMDYSYATGENPQYSGNISEHQWVSAADVAVRRYIYQYDNVNRLVAATYDELYRSSIGMSLTNAADYSTTYAYDHNSNPTHITRNGLADIVTQNDYPWMTFGQVDDLTLTYNGNQLVRTDDAAAATLYTGAPDFHDGVQRAGEYRYDRCGRMVADDNRSIRSVAYNYLGLPSRIVMDHSVSDSVVITRKYRADGVLMSETTGMPYTVTLPGAGWGVNVPIIPGHPIGGGTPGPGTTGLTRQTVTRNFVGSYVLRGTTLERIATAYGYLQGDSAAVRIYTRDLQGNIRAVTDLAGNLLQTNHYYPYGMPFGEAVAPQLPRFGSDVQSYRFSGHRYIQTSGLNLCDFPARPYNPALCQFICGDTFSWLNSSVSPYIYCSANSVNRSDPSGCIDYWDYDHVIGTDGINDGRIYLIRTTIEEFPQLNGEIVPGNNISQAAYYKTVKCIAANSGNHEFFIHNNWIDENCIEIESNFAAREEMFDFISNDNADGKKDDSHFREYGGIIINGEVTCVGIGEKYVADSRIVELAFPTLTHNTFHSHPSGTWITGSFLQGFNQSPTIQDIKSVGIGTINYVFGRRDHNIYIYTKNGIEAIITEALYIQSLGKPYLDNKYGY